MGLSISTINEVMPGAHPLTMRFLKGVCNPSFDLPLVQEALCDSPFEPVESVDMKFLSLKTALLLALTSPIFMGDLHGLLVHPS